MRFLSTLELEVRGASHARRMEFALRGMPEDFRVDRKALAKFMARRLPGAGAAVTARKETDDIHYTGETSGYILNEDARPEAYKANRTVPRPGHADFPQYVRFGRIPSGGGMNSGRMTAALCAAGGMCLQYAGKRGIEIAARIVRTGDIAAAQRDGDSVGGVIECEIRGMPVGIGGALFDGLDGAIARAVFAIPGVKGVELGKGFAAAESRGSENNDAFAVRSGEIVTRTNNHGGILGGYSSGMPIVFRVAMKPTPTIFREQESVDLATMRKAKLVMSGRHDACIAIRAVPVVEAMSALAVADALVRTECSLPRICLTLTGKTLAENWRQYCAERLFADMVELRVDLLEKNELKRAAGFAKKLKVPVILTCRRKCDGGKWTGSEKSRAELLKKLVVTGNFEYVDVEADCSSELLTRLRQTRPQKVVRSVHCSAKEMSGAIGSLRKTDGEIIKLAVRVENLGEVERVMRFAARLDSAHVVMATGRIGFVTRVLAAKMKSQWVYTSTGGLEELGHVSPTELVRDYRLRDLDLAECSEKKLFGVTGWPLAKTRSPEIHNATFFREGAAAMMVPIPSASIADAVGFAKRMNFGGLAVTIPHKVSVMKCLDRLDRTAKAVGAVNTVSFVNGKLVGYNTDVEGFGRAITEFLEGRPLKGMSVALLGNGGAAKACRHALKGFGAKVTLFHRRKLEGRFELIVNATPADPIPEYRFRGDELVFDLRYEPEETELMTRARQAGCRAANGLSMLRHQAEAQRRIWGMEA